MSQEYVTCMDKLSPFYVYEPKLPLVKKRVPSVEHAMWYLAFLRHGRGDLAKRLLGHKSLAKDPYSIRGWSIDCGFVMHASWVFDIAALYHDILQYQISVKSEFYSAMKEVLERHENPENLEFLLCSSSGSEMVLSTGWKKHMHQTNRHSRKHPGCNLYGEALGKAARSVLDCSEIRYLLAPVASLIDAAYPVAQGPAGTVLLLSDSQGRNIEQLYGGRVVRVSGGTFETIADRVAGEMLRVSAFAIVIVSAGINDIQRYDASGCIKSMRKMLDLLQSELSGNTTTQVLISPTFHHPKFAASDGYAGWIAREISHPMWKFVTWQENPFVECRLVKPNVEKKWIKPDCFERDQLHLSHVGFRFLWETWATYIPQLRSVRYTLSKVSYKHEKQDRKRRLEMAQI